MGDLAVSSPGADSDLDLIVKSATEEVEEKSEERNGEKEKEEAEGEKDEDKVEGEADEKAEEEEKEAEEKDEDEEKDEEVIPPSRPTVKAIEAKHPGFFKDFPGLRHAFFREQEYTKVFPTVEDAKDASDRIGELESFTELVGSGDVKGFLEALDETDRSMSKKFVQNFLPGLYKTNADSYYGITTPLLENFLQGLHQHGVQSKDDNIKAAALVASLWAFGDTKIATGEKSSAPPQKEEGGKRSDLDQERDEFYAERFVAFRSDVEATASKQLRASVLGTKGKSFDPDGVFGSELKTILVDRICDDVDKALQADTEHMGRIASIWKRAAKAGYAGDWKSRITSAYLERARTIMPAIRKRVVKATISSKQGESERLAERGEKGVDRKEITGSHSPKGGKTRTPTAKEVDWDKTSDYDFLSGNIKTKGKG